MPTLAELLRGGHSALQGASNAAASNVTGLVDLLALGLRKGGLPIPDDPVGGSAWARQMGLTREPENKMMGLLGEGVGLAAPFVAVAKAPQIAAGANQAIANALAPATMNKQKGAIGYPRDTALKTAQRNAAKPVSEGGLGLPANNTPEMRAQAMGFTDDVYHGTNAEIKAFDPKKSTQGGITWYAEKPVYTDDFVSASGGNVLPLKVNKGTSAGWKEYDDLGLGQIEGRGFNSVNLPSTGDDAVGFVFDPSRLRSRFAAFDPKRRNSADLLAGTMPFLAMPEEQRNRLMELLRK